MVYSYSFFHQSGEKIVIEQIPKLESEKESFEIMLLLQKQIDQIDASPNPEKTYKFTS